MSHRMAYSDYDPQGDLQRLLSDPSSLLSLGQKINYTNGYKLHLDNEIAQNCQEYEVYLQSDSQFSAQDTRQTLERMIAEVEENKGLSNNTQRVITEMTSGIKKLDDAKKNLVLSMTVLKRLQMMIIADEHLGSLVEEKRYSEALPLLGAVGELVDHFKSYKSIDSIAELTRKVNQLKLMLADQIFKDFDLTITNKDPIPEIELRSACEILDTLGQEYHDKLLNWFCNQELREIKTIFGSNDEAGSLENLPRRFIFFKRVLKSHEQQFHLFLPESWKVEEELSKRFCEHTRDSIKQVLAGSGKDTNVDLLLNSLQQTLDFEKFLNNRFRSKGDDSINSSVADFTTTIKVDSKFTHKISQAFEPFLGLWVDHQNSFLSSKFMEFLSQPKLPEDASQGHANVIPSSADLFRAYRHLLTQCSNLSKGSPLYDLSKLFQKWSLEYSNRILKPTLPTTQINDEAVQYITLVLNTADYCNTTIGQLEERLIELVDEKYKQKISFEKSKDSFLKLISLSLNILVHKIETESEFAWREMANTNWAHMEDVGDQSRYIATLRDILIRNCSNILPKFSREIYVRNFCDKVVETTVNQFLASIVKIKPIPVIAAEQMLLDLSVLKETFLKLPKLVGPDYVISSQYQKHAERLTGKLEIILKVLLTQDAPQEGLVTNYFYLIGDKSVINFIKVLELKGITDKNRQTKYIDLFKIHMKAHDNLVDSSPVLSKLFINSTPSSTSSASGLIASKVKSPHSPSSPRFDNILKKDNIEKGLKELAINGEAGVSKFNERFGRFFNRQHHNP
jgi:hypothetical protein